MTRGLSSVMSGRSIGREANSFPVTESHSRMFFWPATSNLFSPGRSFSVMIWSSASSSRNSALACRAGLDCEIAATDVKKNKSAIDMTRTSTSNTIRNAAGRKLNRKFEFLSSAYSDHSCKELAPDRERRIQLPDRDCYRPHGTSRHMGFPGLSRARMRYQRLHATKQRQDVHYRQYPTALTGE